MAAIRTREAICAEVARLLAEERTRQGVSLNGLSQKAGLARQTIAFIEQQERKPTLDTLLRIAEVLGVKIEDVIRQARRQAQNAQK